MKNKINWKKVDQGKQGIINRIASRATKIVHGDVMQHTININAALIGGTHMDLQMLLDFDDFYFVQDILGITEHINRTTGELINGFIPRCASKNTAN